MCVAAVINVSCVSANPNQKVDVYGLRRKNSNSSEVFMEAVGH